MTSSPRGRLADVPLAMRRIWSLLYRAIRRQAVVVDRLTVATDALAAGVDQLHDRVVQLETSNEQLVERVTWLESQDEEAETR